MIYARKTPFIYLGNGSWAYYQFFTVCRLHTEIAAACLNFFFTLHFNSFLVLFFSLKKFYFLFFFFGMPKGYNKKKEKRRKKKEIVTLLKLTQKVV